VLVMSVSELIEQKEQLGELQGKKLSAKSKKCGSWLRGVSFLSRVASSGGMIVDSSEVDVVF
jgi:hypothetical protein